MIGFEQLLREERHRVCIDIVADQLENIAGEIVRIILQQSMNQELGSAPGKSSALSLDEIYQKIKENTAALKQQATRGVNSSSSNNNANAQLLANLDIATVKKLLEVMRLSSLGAVVRVSFVILVS